jgi:hypothetical protein
MRKYKAKANMEERQRGERNCWTVRRAAPSNLRALLSIALISLRTTLKRLTQPCTPC